MKEQHKGLNNQSFQSFAQRSLVAGYNWGGFIYYVYGPTSGYALKSSVNWLTNGFNTPVRNQGACGDCWAFASTGSMEAAYYVKYKKFITLSPQQLTSCSSAYNNNGCTGGMMYNAYKYANAYGVSLESSYPFSANSFYYAITGTCALNSGPYKVTNFVWAQQGSDAAVMEMLDLYGPLAVAIDASAAAFQSYKSGIYASTAGFCSSTTIDHAVLLVGYGVDASGNKYWTIKNQWGTTWGNAGYMNIARGIPNNCAISLYAMTPIMA
jgi:cathepsin L